MHRAWCGKIVERIEIDRCGLQPERGIGIIVKLFFVLTRHAVQDVHVGVRKHGVDQLGGLLDLLYGSVQGKYRAIFRRKGLRTKADTVDADALQGVKLVPRPALALDFKSELLEVLKIKALTDYLSQQFDLFRAQDRRRSTSHENCINLVRSHEMSLKTELGNERIEIVLDICIGVVFGFLE